MSKATTKWLMHILSLRDPLAPLQFMRNSGIEVNHDGLYGFTKCKSAGQRMSGPNRLLLLVSPSHAPLGS